MQITPGDDLTGIGWPSLEMSSQPTENLRSCRFQPSETEVTQQVYAISLKGSRGEGFDMGQRDKQTLTFAEIRVHIMLLVSNLWMSFEKQSAWKRAQLPNR